MNRRNLAFLLLLPALAAPSERSPSERIVLPANQVETDLVLRLRPDAPKAAKVNLLPLVDAKGALLSPQPVASGETLSGNTLRLHLSDIHFWGEAKLQVQLLPGSLYSYTLQRGPSISPTDVHAGRADPGEIWLYNFDTKPLNVKWRLVSGTESVCGIGAQGQPVRDCGSVAGWSSVTIGPVRSDRIQFAVPDWWFQPLNAFSNDLRQAQLELRFGNDESSPLLRTPLKLHLDNHLSDAFVLWTPSWVPSTWRITQHLLWVTFWVTFGAVLLMLAQVMIPNFRKCLRMEGQIESLQERLRAIGSRVGDRLSMRCHQELESVRTGLAMNQGASKLWFLGWGRLALSGNTAEVNRLAAILPRIESRIRLAERLDERQSATLEPDAVEIPPSLCWNREQQLRSIQGILSHQFITDGDERTASSTLDLLADLAASIKAFSAELEGRIAAIRREFAGEPWKSKAAALIAGLDSCVELLQDPPKPVPEGGWSADELVARDLAAVKLGIVYQMILLEPLLTGKPAVKTAVQEKLRSNDPVTLADARLDLVKLSQGVWETDIQNALERGMWDAYFEPVTVTDQDVLGMSLIFRDKNLNSRAAKNSFHCYWQITMTPDGGTGPYESYEKGWEAQFIPRRGEIKVAAEIYDDAGAQVPIRPTTDAGKGVISFRVGPPPSNTLRSRLMRGLVDACITAVVPVLTVALTQVQNGGDLGLDKLVLLGFTSQAIRAAVVPESVSPTSDVQTVKAAVADVRA